jgi:ubiquinone/menaquinone biosynthesis C-methylase UbiE
MEPKEDKNNEKHQENEIINEKQLNAKKSKSDKPKEKNKGKLNIKQLSQSTQKEINLESVSSLQDFGVTINQSVSDKPTEIEKKHVYEVYDKISEHFSQTRYKPWPLVSEFLNSLEKNSMVLDVGCGNGKYLSENKNLVMWGTDRSGNLLSIAKEKNINAQCFIADSLKLPIKSESFDAAISIAVIHHFSNELLRIQALKEIFRVIKKNGKVLIYVWAMEQKEKKFKEQDNFVPWHLQKKYENESKVETMENGPNITEDKNINCKVYQRYYHVFIKGELEDIINKTGDNVEIIKSYFDHANWCCIVQKK